jgi:hypothetical protein
MRRRIRRVKRVRWFTAALAATLVAAAFTSSPARGDSSLGDCPEIVPLSQVQKGMFGTGYTVVEGRNPTAFQVEILGIYPNGMGPGRDIIIIEASGPAVDQYGIWAGMSGSPVYFGDRLVGAVSLGLAFGPSQIGGVTPAEDMADVLDYPENSSGSGDARTPAGRVMLSERMVSNISSETGTSESVLDQGLLPLKTPLSVSGTTPRALARVRQAVANDGLPFIPYAGGSVSAAEATAATGSVDPGDNFAAAFSYGDITMAGIGTTTYVCDGKVLAFGHPFALEGPTTLGANDAEAITIVDDIFIPYKLATIAEGVGTVDQDRFAAIRALTGQMPAMTPITSTVIDLDLVRSRDGETDAVISEIVPFLSFIHMFSNIDTTIDRIGEGSSTVSWTINGTRESGDPWTLTRSNLYTSEFDISFESLFEMLSNLDNIFYNEFEEVEFTSVDADVSIEQAVKRYRVTNLLVSINGGQYRDVRRIRVHRGDVLGVRAVLIPFDGSADRLVDMTLRVPNRVRSGGEIQVGRRGFYEFYECFFGCADGSGKVESFDDLLASLQEAPTNNEVHAKLRMGNRLRVRSADFEVLDQVVDGFKRIRVRLIGGGAVVVPLEG